MSTVTIKKVSELIDSEFTIPSYQRGYRWRDTHVEQLLDDLYEFHLADKGDPDSWYCLQPLVVKNAKENGEPSSAGVVDQLPCGHTQSSAPQNGGKWIVIDGQQRLTTLFIILSQLAPNNNLKPIEYTTRTRSRDFLKKIASSEEISDKELTNPDYYHMNDAKKTVMNWLGKRGNIDKEVFATTILEKAKFIWYETHEDHYDVFTRLNSGKISLSNAELIKALLLRKNRFNDKGGTVELQQLEIAGEWDRIEQALHDDEFWYFINPDPTNSRFNATHIDFVFELVLRKGFEDVKPVENINNAKSNEYAGFKTFSDYCKDHQTENPEETIWTEIRSVFRSIKSWYDDRALYHRVGFLMNRRGEDVESRFKTLIDLLNLSGRVTHSAFKKELARRCRNAIKTKKLDQLKYNRSSEDRRILNDVLLLFNLALLDRQSSEQSRYPFKTHTGTAWSLEHIHAKKEPELNDAEMQMMSEDLCGKPDATLEEVNRKLEERFGKENVSLEERLIDGEKKGLFLVCNQQNIDGLENLALLEREKNSEFSNKRYPKKRRMLSLWEQDGAVEEMGEVDLPAFIPLGTRMAFFKHFSPHGTAPFIWDSRDSKAYFDAIARTVAAYTGLSQEDLVSEKTENT